MAAPDFYQKTKDLLAYRSAYLCNNPDCIRLTAGPSIENEVGKISTGCAAHICDARGEDPNANPTIRFNPKMSFEVRADISNGIWLCRNCHDLIDKNKGRDFPAKLLKKWKSEHESTIMGLLKSGGSSLPLIRQNSIDTVNAQEMIDYLEGKGVFYEHHAHEDPKHVISSLKEVRKVLTAICRNIKSDKDLKQIVLRIIDLIKYYMNMTAKYSNYSELQMESMRFSIGLNLKILNEKYRCNIPKNISQTVP